MTKNVFRCSLDFFASRFSYFVTVIAVYIVSWRRAWLCGFSSVFGRRTFLWSM